MRIEPQEIPNSWKFTTLGKVSTVIGGGTPKTREPDNYEGGRIPWLTPADLSGYTQKKIGHGRRFITAKGLSTSSARMIPTGTVLYTSRAPIGYVAIASNPICTNQGFKSFVLNEGILSEYVYWYLKGTKGLAESLASGTTFLELSGAKAKQIPIPIAPFNEQKRIVAEIEKQFSRLDEAVANLKRIKANLKRYKASVLKAAVEGRLTEEWRKANPDVEPADKFLKCILIERRKKWEASELAKMKAKGKEPKDDKWKKKYKEPANPDIDILPSLPDGWIWVTYEQLGEWTGGGTPSKRKPEYWTEGKIPWVSPKDMKTDKIDKTIDKITAKAVKESVAKLIPSNSLLFVVRSGILRRILPIALTKVDVTVNQDLKALTPSNLLNANYVFLSTQAFSEDILHKCQKDGTTVESIEASALQRFPISFPSEKEQKIIVDEIEKYLSVVEGIASIVEKNIRYAGHLRQSILKKAFTGKLLPQINNAESPLIPQKQSI